MARRIRWTAVAADDLEAVVRYVEQDSLEAAKAIARSAMKSARRLANQAEAGSIVPEFDDPSLREVSVNRTYRLMYRVFHSHCDIVAFLHHARDIERLNVTSSD